MPAGRPRAFDADKALDSALHVFWQKGYEGASLPDLTKAMGINRPSLYAAFGNKEELFRKALDRYCANNTCAREALELPKARAVVEKLLYGVVDAQTDPRRPRGCMMVQAALAAGDTADCIRRELVARRTQSEKVLCARFERAKDESDLPATSNPADLARYISTVIQGMAVQASGGASPDELRRVADMALMAWPT